MIRLNVHSPFTFTKIPFINTDKFAEGIKIIFQKAMEEQDKIAQQPPPQKDTKRYQAFGTYPSQK